MIKYWQRFWLRESSKIGEIRNLEQFNDVKNCLYLTWKNSRVEKANMGFLPKKYMNLYMVRIKVQINFFGSKALIS